jgi:hypothetical protein
MQIAQTQNLGVHFKMANIAISDLRSIDANLSPVSKMFLNNLTEQEIANVLGGLHIHIELFYKQLIIDIQL